MLEVTFKNFIFFCDKCICSDIEKNYSPEGPLRMFCKICKSSTNINCLEESDYLKLFRDKNIDKIVD